MKPGSLRGVFLAGALLFVMAYYAWRVVFGAHASGDALLLIPAASVLALALRRSFESKGRAPWFWGMGASAMALWMIGQVLWALLVRGGLDPGALSDSMLALPVPMDAFFIGFLVPLLGALALVPHQRPARWDAVAAIDCALMLIGVSFVFARFVFLPLLTETPLAMRNLLLGALSWSLAACSLVLWRGVEERGPRRAYGALALFGLLYGVLSSLANGSGGPMPPPGGPFDLAWIVPFFGLGFAALPASGRPPFRISSSLAVTLSAAALGLDLAADRWLPQAAGAGHADHLPLLLGASALLALTCAARLALEGEAEARARADSAVRSQSRERARRLEALSLLSGSSVREIADAVEELFARAQNIAPAVGDRGARMLAQAWRCRAIVQEMTAALSLKVPGARGAVEVVRLLEDTARAALAEGLALRVLLPGGGLPPALGDPERLALAFRHLMRNAAEANPGGELRISGESRPGEILLRFSDDGPGFPTEIRHRVFDPFFTTRDARGLGLTFVDAVARDHGGSAALEAQAAGACVTLRLPILDRRQASAAARRWPLAAASLVSAALVTILAVLPPDPLRVVSLAALLTAAALAAAALAWTAARRGGRERGFWALLATGPVLLACVRASGLAPGAAAGAGLAPLFDTATESLWAAALLLRPDQRLKGRPLAVALLLTAVALLLLSRPFAPVFAALLLPTSLARPAQIASRAACHVGLAAWAAFLSKRAASARWRGTFRALAVVLALWAGGGWIADATQGGPGVAGLGLLGEIVPLVFLAALAVGEARRRTSEEQAGKDAPEISQSVPAAS